MIINADWIVYYLVGLTLIVHQHTIWLIIITVVSHEQMDEALEIVKNGYVQTKI